MFSHLFFLSPHPLQIFSITFVFPFPYPTFLYLSFFPSFIPFQFPSSLHFLAPYFPSFLSHLPVPYLSLPFFLSLLYSLSIPCPSLSIPFPYFPSFPSHLSFPFLTYSVCFLPPLPVPLFTEPVVNHRHIHHLKEIN